MTIDTWLGLLGIIVGFFGIILAYVFYRKSIRTKVLAISYTDGIPLMMTLGGLEVVYENTAISSLSRIYVLLWNRGTSAIEEADFLAPILITAPTSILSLQIHDKDSAAAVVLDEKSRSISIPLATG